MLSRRWPAALLVLLPLTPAGAAITRGEVARLEAGLGISNIRILTTLDASTISRNAADDVQRSLVAIHQLDTTASNADTTIYCTSPQLFATIDINTPRAAIDACTAGAHGPAYPVVQAPRATLPLHALAAEQATTAADLTTPLRR